MQTKHTEAKQSSRTKWTATSVLLTLLIAMFGTSCEESSADIVSATSGSSKHQGGVVTVMRVQYHQPKKLFAMNDVQPGQVVTLSDDAGDNASFVQNGTLKLSYVADEPIQSGSEVSVVFYHRSRIQMTTFGSESVPGELFQIGVINVNSYVGEILSKVTKVEPAFKL